MKGIEQQSYFYFLGNKSYEKMPVEVEEQCSVAGQNVSEFKKS